MEGLVVQDELAPPYEAFGVVLRAGVHRSSTKSHGSAGQQWGRQVRPLYSTRPDIDIVLPGRGSGMGNHQFSASEPHLQRLSAFG